MYLFEDVFQLDRMTFFQIPCSLVMMVESNEVGDQLKQYNCPILNNRYDKFSKKCMNTEYRYNMNIDILILKYSLNLDNLFHTS